MSFMNQSGGRVKRTKDKTNYGIKEDKEIVIETFEPFLVIPVFKGRGTPAKVANVNTAQEAAELHLGSSIERISQGQAGQIYVTTKSGEKYSVRRRNQIG